MQEFGGLLEALDPRASETLRIIAEFDRLVGGRAAPEHMMRAAAARCAATIGFTPAGARLGIRIGSDGRELSPGLADQWPTHRGDDGSIVWIERGPTVDLGDRMILERLAIALQVSSRQLDTYADTRLAVDVLVSGGDDDRTAAAAARLRLIDGDRMVAIAVLADGAAPVLPHAVVATPHGIVQAAIAVGDAGIPARCGIGLVVTSARDLRRSWRGALVALALTDPQVPVKDASELGLLLPFAEAHFHGAPSHPDLTALDDVLLGPWNDSALEACAAGASQRDLAKLLNVHHSTVPDRLRQLTDVLGFDARSPLGRVRLSTAKILRRVRNAHF